MPLTLTFNPTSPHSVISGEAFTLIITLNWLATDTAPSQNQLLQIVLPAQQPIPNGSAVIFNPPGPAPAQVLPQQGSFVAATATTPGQLRYLVGIEAGREGRVHFVASLVNMALPTETFELVITPGQFNLSTTGFTQRAISVANVDNLTPVNAPNNLRSILEIQAVSLETPPAPVPNAAISFTIENVAAEVAQQGGNYFDVTGAAATPINVVRNNNDETGSFTLLTNAAGIARLEIVSNTRASFISCRISGGANSVIPQVLYIYSQPSNISMMPEPVVILPRSNTANFDTTSFMQNTFPIQISNRLFQDSNCVAILNDLYQDDQPVSVFNGGKIRLNGRTADLLTSNTGMNNRIFYAVSNGPELISSRALAFTVRNDNGTVDPDIIRLEGFVDPRNGDMTPTSINRGLPVTIPLGLDQGRVQAANRPAMAAPVVCRILATVTGFDQNGDPIQPRNPVYPFPIANFAAPVVTNQINIFAEFTGLGRSRDGLQTSRWTMRYAFFENANSPTPFAQSDIVQGNIASRTIERN